MQQYSWENGRVVKTISQERLFFMQAILNSLVMDRFARFSVNITVSKTILQTLPLPQPTDSEIHENPLYARLVVPLSKTLSYYHNPTGFCVA